MGIMTKLDGVPDREDAKPGMAFFANTGPFGATCGDCSHRRFKQGKGMACAMYHKLTGRHGAAVDRHWSACKYFEPRAVKQK
jgi:hypothetical protein